MADKTKSSRKLSHVIDKIEEMREELLAMQHTLEQLESGESKGERNDVEIKTPSQLD